MWCQFELVCVTRSCETLETAPVYADRRDKVPDPPGSSQVGPGLLGHSPPVQGPTPRGIRFSSLGCSRCTGVKRPRGTSILGLPAALQSPELYWGSDRPVAGLREGGSRRSPQFGHRSDKVKGNAGGFRGNDPVTARRPFRIVRASARRRDRKMDLSPPVAASWSVHQIPHQRDREEGARSGRSGCERDSC